MKFTTPILIEARRERDVPGAVHYVRPVFFPHLVEASNELSRALAKLAHRLREHLRGEAIGGNHRYVERYTFNPKMMLSRLPLRLDLQDHLALGTFPVVTFRSLQRRLGFVPTLPDVWFELQRGENLAERASEELTRYFRKLAKNEEHDYVAEVLKPFAQKGQIWLDTLEFDVATGQKFTDTNIHANFFAALGGSQSFEGETELRKVGRCLDWQYPDRLQRCTRRDDLVQHFSQLMTADDQRPVLLLGQRKVGKTALIHEHVFRTARERGGGMRSKQNLWSISPQRLISGMSYVGQWEDRLLAILKYCRKENHTLYFTDLVGLFRAGVSASSCLSVADVLKPYLERREVRILGEATPAQLRVLRELDRSFADMFHPLLIEEPSPDCTQRILLDTVRRLELRERCRFEADVLPSAVSLTRRYEREAAMPGKAVDLLEQLAVKFAKKTITHGNALEEFHRKSGLNADLLDTRKQLDQKEVLKALQRDVVGQPAALATMVDVIGIAKARLNDPTRPLATLLFLGPTGVGKTQAAKALAKYLFGDAERLLRFDMNEFSTPGSGTRLTGGHDHPEGLLTSAVRREPFAVILLDEIEKAHGDVLDTLLQVLGEGRLTDALGRTADFTNVVIILTSNLGSREASKSIGLHTAATTSNGGTIDRSHTFVKAAERFFRPEFFNRLDRITPFESLGRDSLAKIARGLIDDVIAREGLARRRSLLAIDEDAIAWIVEKGFHPQLGARAMRRAVEQELVAPVAWQLANMARGSPLSLRVRRRQVESTVDTSGLRISVTPLRNAQPLPGAGAPDLSDIPAVLENCLQVIDRVEAVCQTQRPAGELISGQIGAEHFQYLELIEFITQLRKQHASLQLKSEATPSDALSLMIAPSPPRSHFDGYGYNEYILGELFAADDIDAYIQEARVHQSSEDKSEFKARVEHLINRLRLIEKIVPNDGWKNERCLLIVRSLSEKRLGHQESFAARISNHFCFTAENDDERDDRFEPTSWSLDSKVLTNWDVPVEKLSSNEAKWRKLNWAVTEYEGCEAIALLKLMEGAHLFPTSDGGLSPLQAVVWPLEDGEDSTAGLERFEQAYYEGIASNDSDVDLFAFDEVVTVTSQQPMRSTLYLRTGKTLSLEAILADAILASLPLPTELQ